MKGFQCDELFAFVAVDTDGDEGVVIAEFEGDAVPLVTADLEKVKLFIPIAERIAQGNRVNIKLYHYKRIGEVSRDFTDQFVGVRLDGDPGGPGTVDTDSDGEHPEGGDDAGAADELGPGDRRRTH